MPALLKTTQIQEPSSASVNLTLDANGNGTFAGTSVMSSPYMMRNKIINGAMVIDQRNAGASVTPASGSYTYTLDRWGAYATQASKFTVQQNAGSVTPPTGYSNYLGATSSSAYTVGAGDAFVFKQAIEGFNIADLGWGAVGALTVTLSFWVRSSLTGTFGGALGSNTANNSYPFSYTISSANTWEQKTITIAGPTSGGTAAFPVNNNTGFNVFFSLGAGSSFSGTAGAWTTSGAFVQPTGSVSVVGTNGATWYVTGVQLERGTVATPFEYRNYQQELAMCQRYYEKINYGGNGMISTGQAYSTSQVQAPFSWKVTKRATPSIAISSTLAGDFMIYGAGGAAYNCTYGFSNITTDCCYINITNAAGSLLVAGNAALLYVNTANQFISISSEL